MHRWMQGHVEELLATRRGAAQPVDAAGEGAAAHLASCRACAGELELMREQAGWLAGLRAPESAEPAPGFYARVVSRIEEERSASMWTAFIYSAFGKRLAYASLALALVVATYVLGLESRDGHLGGPVATPVVAVSAQDSDAPVIGDQQQQRDAVLVNLASYEETVQ